MRTAALALLAAGAPALHAAVPLDAAERAKAEALSARLLAASSATGVLEEICGGRVAAQLVPGDAPVLGEAERARLQVGADELLGYRHVRLACRGVVLSDAENWFVPARLTPEMRRLLAETDTPFGAVIRPLQPRRDNRVVEGTPTGATLFVHEGLVRAADGRPLAFVRERYQRGLLR